MVMKYANRNHSLEINEFNVKIDGLLLGPRFLISVGYSQDKFDMLQCTQGRAPSHLIFFARHVLHASLAGGLRTISDELCMD